MENNEFLEAQKALNAAVKDFAAASREIKDPRLTQAVMEEIAGMIAVAEEIFGQYVHALTSAERKRLHGASYKTYGFIAQAYASSKMHAELLPSYLTADKFQNDFYTYERLKNIDELVAHFQTSVDDTMLYSCDEVYRDAIAYYSNVKEAAKRGIVGAQAEYDALKAFFHHSGKSSGEPTESQIERDMRSLLEGRKEGRIAVENVKPSVSSGERKVIDDVHSDHIEARDNVSINRSL